MSAIFWKFRHCNFLRGDFLYGSEILNDIKKAALEAVSAACPCEIKFGTVTSVKPLTVRLEQKILLSGEALILPRKFTDHTVKISGKNIGDFYFSSGSSAEPVDPPHTHALGEMEITVHVGLNVGDKLILIRQQGGQKFLIFDLIIEE